MENSNFVSSNELFEYTKELLGDTNWGHVQRWLNLARSFQRVIQWNSLALVVMQPNVGATVPSRQARRSKRHLRWRREDATSYLDGPQGPTGVDSQAGAQFGIPGAVLVIFYQKR